MKRLIILIPLLLFANFSIAYDTQSGEEDQARAAEDAFVAVGGDEGMQVMIQKLKEPEHGAELYDILPRIAEMGEGGIAAGEAVKNKLSSDNRITRCMAAKTLGFIGYEDATDELITMLDLDGDWLDVASAAEGLGRMKAEAALPKLEYIRDNYWYVLTRQEAGKAIDVIKGTDEYEPYKSSGEYYYKMAPSFSWNYKYEPCKSTDYPLQKASPVYMKLYKKDNKALFEGFTYTWKDGTGENHMREQTPDVAVQLDEGWLLGRDYGEFGGELVYWRSKDDYRILVDDNVKEILTAPEGIFVPVGLSHMAMNYCELYKIIKTEEGEWKAEKLHDLPAAVKDSAVLADGRLLLNTRRGSITYDPATDKFEMAECSE